MFHPINRVATEDKYGSSVALEGETTDEEEKKAKQDEGEIFRLLQWWCRLHHCEIPTNGQMSF